MLSELSSHPPSEPRTGPLSRRWLNGQFPLQLEFSQAGTFRLGRAGSSSGCVLELLEVMLVFVQAPQA